MPTLNDQAVQVRQLIEHIATRFNNGEDGWQADFDRAKQLAESIDDPASRDDAAIRVSGIERHLCQLAGDSAGALRHCEQDLAAIARQRRRFPEPAEQSRLDDHEWVVRLAQAHILTNIDLPRAKQEARRCLELSATTLAPEQRRAASLLLIAGHTLHAQNYPQAQREYTEALAQCRLHEPDSMGIALLGLAQAQAQSGELAAASATADRAQPLLAEDPSGTADLLHLRATIAQSAGDFLAAQRFTTAHTTHSANYESKLFAHQRHLAATSTAHLAHLGGEVFAAKEHYDRLVDQARQGHDRVGLAITLLNASCAAQDCALALGPQDGLADHQAALAQLDEARTIFGEVNQLVHLAGADYLRASFVVQFHPILDQHTEPRLREALVQCQAAAIFLQHSSFAAQTGPARHAFVVKYAMAAFEAAFVLAFWFGDSRQVAELVELRCASAQFQVTPAAAPQPGDFPADLAELSDTEVSVSAVAASPAPPLLFAPGQPLLPAAYARARQVYGLVLADAPSPTW